MSNIDLAPDRADRITMRVIGVLVGALTLVLALQAGLTAGTFVWSPTLTLTLLSDAPAPASGIVTSALFDSVIVTTEALSAGARACYAAGSVLLAVTTLIVGGALTWLMMVTAAGARIRSGLFHFTFAAGFALVLGPLLATALTGFGSMQAAFELDAALPDTLVPGFAVSGWGIAIPMVGMGLLVLGYIFRYLQRLQRETEGLV